VEKEPQLIRKSRLNASRRVEVTKKPTQGIQSKPNRLFVCLLLASRHLAHIQLTPAAEAEAPNQC